MAIEYANISADFKLSIFGLGKLSLDMLEQIQCDYTNSDSLNLISSKIESEKLCQSTSDHLLLLKPIPMQYKQKHREPKTWLSPENYYLTSCHLAGTATSLIMIDGSADDIYHDYAKSIADLSKSFGLITIIAFINITEGVNEEFVDAQTTLSSQFQEYADLILELPHLDTQQGDLRSNRPPSYQKLKALIQITTRDEESPFNIEMSDLRYCLTTKFNTQVTLCYIESSKNNLELNSQIIKYLSEEKSPLMNQSSFLVAHFLCGTNASYNWVLDCMTQLQSEIGPKCDMLCSFIQDETLQANTVKFACIAVLK